MRNAISYCETPLDGVQSFSRSAFMIDDEEELSPFSGAVDPVSAVAEAVGKISEMLPKIGIGSRSRLKETNATAAANTSLVDAQKQSELSIIAAQTAAESKTTKNKEKIYLIVGVGVMLLIVVAGVLFTRR